MSLFYNLIKPILFKIDPENAHELIANFLELGEKVFSNKFSPLLEKIFCYNSKRLEINLSDSNFDLEFKGPLGLAAGFDKTGKLFPALSLLGFNFVECGTFTPNYQSGNSKPRLFRIESQEALINRMGFNNPGSVNVANIFKNQFEKMDLNSNLKSSLKSYLNSNLKSSLKSNLRSTLNSNLSKTNVSHNNISRNIIRGINIGKGKETTIENAINDYDICAKNLSSYADYLCINISSPNTPLLRKIQNEPKIITDILQSLKKYSKPIFVKIAPDLELKEVDNIIKILIEEKVMGLVLTNTTIDQSKIEENLREEGGLSGKPLKTKSNMLIKHTFINYKNKLKIIGVGGVMSGADALEKILLGASLVQIYTGYVYKGPRLTYEINKYIDEYLKKENKNISEIIGSGCDI